MPMALTAGWQRQRIYDCERHKSAHYWQHMHGYASRHYSNEAKEGDIVYIFNEPPPSKKLLTPGH
jgi:ribosomal protein S17